MRVCVRIREYANAVVVSYVIPCNQIPIGQVDRFCRESGFDFCTNGGGEVIIIEITLKKMEVRK